MSVAMWSSGGTVREGGRIGVYGEMEEWRRGEGAARMD